jgi:hypothetical protein
MAPRAIESVKERERELVRDKEGERERERERRGMRRIAGQNISTDKLRAKIT